jgi:hypothetical protein
MMNMVIIIDWEVTRSHSNRDCFRLLSQRFAMPRNDILWESPALRHSGSPVPQHSRSPARYPSDPDV